MDRIAQLAARAAKRLPLFDGESKRLRKAEIVERKYGVSRNGWKGFLTLDLTVE
jgi:hypothetical protein